MQWLGFCAMLVLAFASLGHAKPFNGYYSNTPKFSGSNFGEGVPKQNYAEGIFTALDAPGYSSPDNGYNFGYAYTI
ncbi:maker677 [Drosophila busckii]|uniref:Maker677 n=1 Tax=Drosophila busckii TaxID=30019 RepID=A0A0M5J836_DROBS|nr:maker677 [Drosophila busckii]